MIIIAIRFAILEDQASSATTASTQALPGVYVYVHGNCVADAQGQRVADLRVCENHPIAHDTRGAPEWYGMVWYKA